MLNLNFFLSYHANNSPQKSAFIQEEKELTFRSMEEEVNKLGNALLELGIIPGDRVAMTCPNIFSFPIVYYAILKIGATVVPLSLLLKSTEIEKQLAHSECKAYFCFEGTDQLPTGKWGIEAFNKVHTCEYFICIPSGHHPMGLRDQMYSLADLVRGKSSKLDTYPSKEEGTAVILYTSGTTGDPKGVEISHSAIVWSAQASFNVFQASRKDVILTALPLFHSFGQGCNMNCSIVGGMTNILLIKFEPLAVLQQMHKYKVTMFTGVPTMFWQLIESGRKEGLKELVSEIRQHLRLCGGGAAKMPPQVTRDFYEMFGLKVYEGMGISECSGIVSLCNIDVDPVIGSIGMPIPGTEFKIIKDDLSSADIEEVGEICIRGASAMKGYLKSPKATAEVFLEGGWIRSGDLGYKDKEGNYHLVDRKKDLIIRGGRNIYPMEVEELIMIHPAVSMVAVYGVADDKYGEEIKASIVLKYGEIIELEELREWIKERIAGYKYPRYIEFVETLPLTASGKIFKKALRELHRS